MEGWVKQFFLSFLSYMYFLQGVLHDFVSPLEPAEAPTGVKTTVMNSTVQVKWIEAQNIRGLLLGYKVVFSTLISPVVCQPLLVSQCVEPLDVTRVTSSSEDIVVFKFIAT